MKLIRNFFPKFRKFTFQIPLASLAHVRWFWFCPTRHITMVYSHLVYESVFLLKLTLYVLMCGYNFYLQTNNFFVCVFLWWQSVICFILFLAHSSLYRVLWFLNVVLFIEHGVLDCVTDRKIDIRFDIWNVRTGLEVRSVIPIHKKMKFWIF